MISGKAADDTKVKNRQIFHLSLPFYRHGFMICGDCGLDCGFCGLWVVMEVVGCGGGCELFCEFVGSV